jgi:hypothetical protein
MKTPFIPLSAALALALASTASAELPYRGDGHVFVDPKDLAWTDIASMAAPAQIAVIEGDLAAAEPVTFRLLLPAGYEIHPHVHPAYERVTVIEGELFFGHGETFDPEHTVRLPQGGFAIMAPGEPMFGYTEVDTVIQLHGTGPWGIDYIDAADDPRS